MGNSAPKKKQRPSASATATAQTSKNTKNGDDTAQQPSLRQDEVAHAPPTQPPVEEPKKRTSFLTKRKSSVKAEKSSFNVTIDEENQVFKFNYKLEGGAEPTEDDMIIVLTGATRAWETRAEGTRQAEVEVQFDWLSGYDESEKFIAKYITNDDDDICRCSSEPFQVPPKKKKQVGPCSLQTKWTDDELLITFSIGTDTSSMDYFAVSKPDSESADYLFWEYNAEGNSSGEFRMAKSLFDSYVGGKVEVRYFSGEDTAASICKSDTFLIPMPPEPQLEAVPAETAAPETAGSAEATISLRWKNDDVLVAEYTLNGTVKPTTSDRVAICLVSSLDTDTLNYEYASGKQSGTVEFKRERFTYTLNPVDQQKLEVRYYLSSGREKPIAYSRERVTLPKTVAGARKSVAGAKPLPVHEDQSVSPEKGYSMTISWDADEEIFKFKVKPPTKVSLTTSHELYLIESKNIGNTSSNHGYARFENNTELGEEANGVWGISPYSPLPAVPYRVALCDEKRNPLAYSQEFAFPDFPRPELFPAPDGKVTAAWSDEDQCVKVNWKALGTQGDPIYYNYIYVYESGVRTKFKNLIMRHISAEEWTEGECEITAEGKLKQDVEYYVRIIENKSNSALICKACSNMFTVTMLEPEDVERQYCDFTLLGEEQETYDGFESSTCTVTWKFTRHAAGLSNSDSIYLIEAEKPGVDNNDWQATYCYASGKPEGKVTFALGGLCKKGQSYRFYYVAKKGKPRTLGKSEPVTFAQLPEQSAEANDKAKEASRKANMSSLTQYQMNTFKTVADFNPLLTIKPEPSKFEKLLQQNLNRHKKRRASADQRTEQQHAAVVVQAKAQVKEADKPLTGPELHQLVEADFTAKGGFIYAGAGVSMAAPASSPSWWLLMNELLRETFNGAPEEHLDLRNKIAVGDVSRQPEEIMESFYYVLQDKLLTVFELLEAGEPNANHKAMARLAKAGKLRGILTTNFDIFIERALKAEGVPFKTVVTADEFAQYYASGCKEFAVLKIHGTVDRPSTIVAVANHYKSGKGFSGAKEQVLGHFLRNHPTLFLGYSGWDFEHANYQSFWSNEGEAGGENIYWLNLIGAKGPDLRKIVGSHVGKRLMIGEDTMPAWALNLLATWDGSGAQAIRDFDVKIDRDAVQRTLVVKRKEFLQRWVAGIPKPQLLTLLQIEGAMLNEKNQERFKRMKEANKSGEEEAGMDTTDMTRVLTQMAMDMAAGKITMEEYMEQNQLITLQITFKYVNMPKEKKNRLMKLYLQDTKTNPLFAPAEKQINKSMLPSILSSVVDGMSADAPVEDIYAEAVKYVAEKMDALEQKGDKLSKAKRAVYMYQSQYLRCDTAGRAECEQLFEDFAKLAVEKGWDDSRIAQEANAHLMKKIMALAWGTIDVEAIQQTQFKELLKIKADEDFLMNAMVVALGTQRSSVYRISARTMMPEYSKMIAIPLYSNQTKRELPPGRLDEFEALLKAQASPEKQQVMKRLESMKGSAEILATFDIGEIEVWIQLLRTSGINYQEEQARDAKGFYPRECLPEFICNHFLPRIKKCYSQAKDARIVQPILALMAIVGESLNDVESLKYATEESLKLTQGKVIELTPVGIPESYAYALQLRSQLADALPFYLKALDGIKTSVMRQKTDAIVLQACLVQAQFDVEKALKLAFTYSPHFGSAQQYTIVGPGRALLVQQCQKWAEDLGYGSLDVAEEKLMKKDE